MSRAGDAVYQTVYSPVMTGLIVTLLLIIGTLVASIVMLFKQVTAYKDDVDNYLSLRGEDASMSSGTVV